MESRSPILASDNDTGASVIRDGPTDRLAPSPPSAVGESVTDLVAAISWLLISRSCNSPQRSSCGRLQYSHWYENPGGPVIIRNRDADLRGTEGIRGMDKGKGLIRSHNRRGSGSAKVRPVEARAGRPREGAVCERCGAMFSRRTWRRDHAVSDSLLARAAWVVCPACQQTGERSTSGGSSSAAVPRWTRTLSAGAPERCRPSRLHAARAAGRVGRAPRGCPRGAHHLPEARAPDRPRAQEGFRGPHVLRMVGRSDAARDLAASRGVRRKAKKALISASGKRHAASALGANSGYPVSRTFAPCNPLRPARTLNNRKPPALTGASKVRGSTSAAPESEGPQRPRRNSARDVGAAPFGSRHRNAGPRSPFVSIWEHAAPAPHDG